MRLSQKSKPTSLFASPVLKHKTISLAATTVAWLVLLGAFFVRGDYATISLFLSIGTLVYVVLWTQEEDSGLHRVTVYLLLSLPIANIIVSLMLLFHTFVSLEAIQIPQVQMG